jgi:Rps23 Pro-64 3,4-dihydroxylase Tpa1-like proline 4-hydroxylase
VIKKHDNFLEPYLFKECVEYADNIWTEKKKNNFRTNYNCWPNYMVIDSDIILIHDIDINSPIHDKLFNVVNNKIGRYTNKFMLCFYMPCSHIPWHNDAHFGSALTIYLNDSWHKNNGGLLHYEINGEIKSIIPEKNMAIEIITPLKHSVGCLTKNSPVRVSIQTFFVKN